MKAVVTGATGMIGYHLCKELSENDIVVYAVVREKSSKINRLANLKNVNIVECNLSNINKLKHLISEECDLFYHLAWDGTFGNDRNNLYGQIQNINYAVNAVDVAHDLGCKTFIGAGSQAEFGRKNQPLNMSLSCEPENGYGVAKLCSCNMTRLECEKYGIKHIWTRILSIYGPYDIPETLVSSTIINLLNGSSIDTTNGEQIWDYLYVKDCVKALFLLGLKGKNNKIYCIGSGEGRPLSEYIKDIRKIIGKGCINFGKKSYSPKQVMYLLADITDLKKDVGFVPSYSFEDGIRETIDYWRGKNE